MNFPEIVDIALPAEGVFHNLVFVSIRKTYPMQAYKVLADGHNARPLGHGPDDVHQILRGGLNIFCEAPAKSTFHLRKKCPATGKSGLVE